MPAALVRLLLLRGEGALLGMLSGLVALAHRATVSIGDAVVAMHHPAAAARERHATNGRRRWPGGLGHPHTDTWHGGWR